MAISELGKPRALDSLVIDDVLFPLTYQDGKLGYMRDGAFITVDPSQLKKAKERRAGSPTWEIKPVGRERVELPTSQPKKPLLRFRVDMSFNKESLPTRIVKAEDAEGARNKAIKGFAFTSHLPYARTFEYFNAHPEAIKVTQL